MKIHNELEVMAHKYNCVRWLRFWHAHHAHFVPAFQGFMLPGLNLAEPGQGAMDRQTTHILTLVDCAYKDLAFQMRTGKSTSGKEGTHLWKFFTNRGYEPGADSSAEPPVFHSR